jgi:hypothetical protein
LIVPLSRGLPLTLLLFGLSRLFGVARLIFLFRLPVTAELLFRFCGPLSLAATRLVFTLLRRARRRAFATARLLFS